MYPILFSLGPITLYSFGLFTALAFLVGLFTIWHFSRSEINDEIILDAVFLVLITGLFGGRIAYILMNREIFGLNFLKMFHMFNFPGISFHIAIISSIIAFLIFTWKKRVKIKIFADFFVLGICLAFFIGSIGCFLDGCVTGTVTKLPWALPAIGKIGLRHPLPVYEALIFLTLYLALYKIYRIRNENRKNPDKKNHYLFQDGIITGIFLFVLGLSQFLLEFIREGSVYWESLKLNQIFDLILIILSLFFFVRFPVNFHFWRKDKTII